MTAARSASACHAHWLKRTESSRTEDGIRSWVRFLAMSFRFRSSRDSFLGVPLKHWL